MLTSCHSVGYRSTLITYVRINGFYINNNHTLLKKVKKLIVAEKDMVPSKNLDGFTLLINDVINDCNSCFFSRDKICTEVDLLHKLLAYIDYFGRNDSSIIVILNEIAKRFEDSQSPSLSLHFYKEQLRIEKLYLGHVHPDLANTLNSIGEVYVNNEQFSEAAKYFEEAFHLLKDTCRRGNFFALILYNLGHAQYHQSLIAIASESFSLASKEQIDALGEFHPDVAEMHLKIGKLLMDYGKIDTAMDYFLRALMVTRMVTGNSCSRVSEILYNIGLCHKMNGEYKQAVNSFYQALDILDGQPVAEEPVILILNQIAIAYHWVEDINNAIIVVEKIISVIENKVGERHVCVAVLLGLLYNLCLEQGMIEKANKVVDEINVICSNEDPNSAKTDCQEFVEFIIHVFGYAIQEIHPPAAAAA